MIARVALALASVGLAGLLAATARDLEPLPAELGPALPGPVELRDRAGRVLTQHYGPGIQADLVPLHAIPERVVQAFLRAEDQRFYAHPGVDLRARAHALLQNARAGRVVRGASTLTEQVVRLLHPRPRTLWSRWLESLEALALERRFTKGEILEFYLNRVPYGRRRHGVRQAARGYFGRDLDTLDAKEALALAVLVRSPSRLDPETDPTRIEPALARLAQRMQVAGELAAQEVAALGERPLVLRPAALQVDAPHFVRWVRAQLGPAPSGSVQTTLDGAVQRRAQALVDQRLRTLRGRHVSGAAVLVVDHANGEVLAWVNAARSAANAPVYAIDAVTAPRQPGSTLKPFLYGLALERGWSAATLVDDAPLASAVGTGQHRYRNYSGLFYGPLRLREALANSLNTPAVRTVRFVTPAALLERLRGLGFAHLDRSADHYGEGLALGSGEVSLLELVRAYAALARGGAPVALRAWSGEGQAAHSAQGMARAQATPSLDADAAAIVADILADPQAREREFGQGLLRLPSQTAVKTGTSSGYHDAWAIGFSDRHTVGVWLGNLDRRPMQEVTGSNGPAWVLRALFEELRRRHGSAPLRLPRHLVRADVCARTGRRARPSCPHVSELFVAGREPAEPCSDAAHAAQRAVAPVGRAGGEAGAELVRLEQPTPGLQLALDPRIPAALERFAFAIPAALEPERVEWWLDGRRIAATGQGVHRYLWSPARGTHRVHARIWMAGSEPAPRTTPEIEFHVK